jgi:hypothetical protein
MGNETSYDTGAITSMIVSAHTGECSEIDLARPAQEGGIS